MTIKRNLLTIGRNWYPWKSNVLMEDIISKNYIDVINQKQEHRFNIIFRVVVYAIRIFFLIKQLCK